VSHRLARTGACDVAVDPGDGVHNPRSASVLGSNGRKPVAQSRALRGVASEVAVYEIRWRQSCWSAGLKARIFHVAPIHEQPGVESHSRRSSRPESSSSIGFQD